MNTESACESIGGDEGTVNTFGFLLSHAKSFVGLSCLMHHLMPAQCPAFGSDVLSASLPIIFPTQREDAIITLWMLRGNSSAPLSWRPQ